MADNLAMIREDDSPCGRGCIQPWVLDPATPLLFSRKQQCEFSAELPICYAVGPDNVVIAGYIRAHWLVADFENPVKTAGGELQP